MPRPLTPITATRSFSPGLDFFSGAAAVIAPDDVATAAARALLACTKSRRVSWLMEILQVLMVWRTFNFIDVCRRVNRQCV